MEQKTQRELFASRLGFILMTAGCAVGLGNVWRFSYITGQYGGGFFVVLYLGFLLLLGFPVMLMELSLGRAGRSTYPGAFRKLQNQQCRFNWYKPVYLLFAGNLILLMFYSVITGWLLIYAVGFLQGKFANVTAATSAAIFGNMLNDPCSQTVSMIISVLITVLVCVGGIRKTIEKTIKIMMFGLFVLLLVLVVQSLQQPGAMKGVSFFLKPDWNKFVSDGILSTIHAAMAQAFFTLSLGIGSIAVCGSYTPDQNSLVKESTWIILLDTFVAVASGLIIFPACASFNIKPDAGPSLIFITLPSVFDSMNGGALWGFIFFIFLSIAALSTLIAVFENLVAFGMDQWRWSRKYSCGIFGILLTVFSLPCIFGFNIWKNFHPLGNSSNILDLEDFIVSDNLLPLGALYLTVFCMNRYGWGAENFLSAASNGRVRKSTKGLYFYLTWVLPVMIFVIWLIGLARRFNLPLPQF